MARSKDIFQLSKRRLRENPKFCALTPSEKWFWLDLCMFLDEQEQPGVARWDLDRLARARHAPVDGYRSLVKQEVLKGAPAGEACAPYIHVDRNGTEHTLIPAQPGPIWFSSAIVRDEHLRQVASKAGREGGGNPNLQSDTFKGRSKGVVKGAPKGVEPDPSPPRGSSPTPLSPNPTHTPIPVAAQPGVDASRPAAKSKKRERKLSDEQNATWSEFREWWTVRAWPAQHQAEVYPFGDKERGHSNDGNASIQICRRASFEIDLIKRVALEFLAQPEMYGNYNHTLTTLLRKFDTIRRQIQSGVTHAPRNGNHRPGQPATSAFTGARRSLPDVVAPPRPAAAEG